MDLIEKRHNDDRFSAKMDAENTEEYWRLLSVYGHTASEFSHCQCNPNKIKGETDVDGS